ncbi:NAD+ synthase [Rickettsiales bacterium]|nr:NAD+ synthase [Rickettsiales bacterium]
MKIQLAQINFIIGDLDGNYNKIITFYQKFQNKVDLVLFSELAICGYPPEDLLLKDYFLEQIEQKLQDIINFTKDKKAAILLGCPARINDQYNNKKLFNAAILIENGAINDIFYKKNLPNYGIFDEKRYFTPANNLKNIQFRGVNLAILICEDIWHLKNSFLLKEQDVDLIIAINASPFEEGKLTKRINNIQEFNKNLQKNIIYLNQVGACDSLIFDGSSFIVNHNNDIIKILGQFKEDSHLVNINDDGNISDQKITLSFSKEERIYNALILGLRDYVIKNGFKNVILGLSGGIDSALVATIAADALGAQNVKLMALPSKYNSNQSYIDAKELSDNLDINLQQIAIQNIFDQIENALNPIFSDCKNDCTEENIQSRIRGLLLMAISNKFGNLLLATGNKSELAVGYATLYGDMNGAYNPLKDLYKTQIYQLSQWRNDNIPAISQLSQKNIIPQNIITKEPTAELRENQKDTDSLPDYNILDQILYLIIEKQMSKEEIIAKNFDTHIVTKIIKMFYNNEFKRQQAVIGPKISQMSFDKDRRYQIGSKFR